jgi:predicted nuclease of restriction endonuclease-like (RecB) superfamily
MSDIPKRLLGDYALLLTEVKERIRSAQYAALKVVNKELISLYWDIGKLIVQRQAGATWGKAVVQNLSEDLQSEFSGISGYSASNLWRMKNFYETYASSEKLAPLVREVAWSHNIIILERCKDQEKQHKQEKSRPRRQNQKIVSIVPCLCLTKKIYGKSYTIKIS